MILNKDHQAIRDTVSSFIEKEINPYTDLWEEEGIFPAHELFKKMGSLGLLGISRSEKFGGMGLDYIYETVFSEELGLINSGGVAMAIGVQTNMATPSLATHGSDELRKDFLMPAISGDMVCSIAVSEPSAGSDVSAIKTTAKKDGDDYIINGTKMWITNSTQADFICLLANTGEGNPHTNKSLIIVPMNLPGISLSERFNKLGMRSSDTAQIFFDDVRIPKENLLGPSEGKGFVQLMQQLPQERLIIAAGACAAIEKALKITSEYVKERKAFGKRILDFQNTQFKLAERYTEARLARVFVDDCAMQLADGKLDEATAAMAKWWTTQKQCEIIDGCLQFFGGYGFMMEYPIAKMYADSRIQKIYGGSNEIMKLLIAREI